MSESVEIDTAELQDGLISLRFKNEDDTLHDLEAADVAAALQGLVEFTGQMSRAGLFGEGMPPRVRVVPPQRGSFDLQTILHFTQENPEVAAAMWTTAGGLLTTAINVATRRLNRTRPTNFEPLPNGDVKLHWSDGSVEQIPEKAWAKLNTLEKKTKQALAKIMAPLGDDVSRVEVRSAPVGAGSDILDEIAPALVLERTDYRIAIATDPEPDDDDQTFEVEATMLSVDFRPGEKWRIEVREGKRRRARTAKMDDASFQQALDAGRALRKSDILRLEIREVATFKGGRINRDWTITQVLGQRRGAGDDDGEASLAQPS